MIKKVLLSLLGILLTTLAANDLKYLTLKEVEWLQNFQRDVVVGITQIPNQVLIAKDGSYRGFSIDLFAEIQKRSGLPIRYKYYNTWGELIQAAKAGDVDVLFLAQKTSSRLRYLYFTDTVMTQKNKLITCINEHFHTLEALKNHTIAITAGSAIEEYLRYYYPSIKLLPTKNELESLKLVESHKADATILELVRASYYMRAYNLNNLVISSDINYNYYLSIASIKKLPELNIILSKTLNTIDSKELQALKLKWGYIKEKKLFFDTQTMIYLAIAFGIIIPFSISLFFINRRLKKEMQEKEKALERVTRLRNSKLNEMSEIISMIAHQWKQPLNNLNLLIQMLKLKYQQNKVDEKLMHYFFENSKKQIELMSNTIDDFRKFFKINEQKKPFELNTMIHNLINITQPLYDKHAITLSFHSKKEENITLYNHQSMLFQIMINILNNAKDALLEKNPQEKKITLEIIKNEQHVSIVITDNAGGIPDTIIDKIFDPYFSTKTEKNGTGLGLYMAKTILEERMQGSISVTNTDEGACFVIELPLTEH